MGVSECSVREEGWGVKLAASLMGAQDAAEICFMRASLVCLYVDRRWRSQRVLGGCGPMLRHPLYIFSRFRALGLLQNLGFLSSSLRFFQRPFPARSCPFL